MLDNSPSASTPNRLLKLLQDLSLAVQAAPNTEVALADVLALIGRFMGWPLGHAFIWSEAEDMLVSSGVWYTAEADTLRAFRELSEKTPFHRGEGTLGRVWVSGEPVMILDVREDDSFVRKLPVEEGGILAYFAFPVKAREQLLAVLEFFSPQAVQPPPDTREVISHASTLLGLAMQRQQMVERLTASEAQLAEAQRTAHVGHWEWDIPTDSVTWSPELYRIYGIDPRKLEATYEGVFSLNHPDDAEYITAKIQDAYQNGRAFDYFHRIVRPDGAVRVIHSRGRPLHDRAGKIVKLLGTVQDMTEQKEAELQLAETVRQLSALMDIGRAVAGSLDLDEIYGTVLSLIRPLLEAEALILLIYDHDALEIVAMDLEDGSIPNMVGVRAPLTGSIVGAAWQSGAPLFVQGDACARLSSPALEEMTGYAPRAALATPVRLRGEAIGVLAAVHSDANAFSEDDLGLLVSAAAWTAVAIGNARQYSAIRRRLSESDAILAISNALTSTLDLEEVLSLIVQETDAAVPHTDWTTIHLLKPGTDRMELAASAGLEIDPQSYVVRLGEGIAGEVLETGEIINVPDVQQDPRRMEVDINTQARALLVAPVESRQRRIGTISMQCSQPATFGADDERFLKILGVQAGLAIENARLYSQQQFGRLRAEKQRERMRAMARRVVQAQEEERSRIARELHDESGQALTSLKISLGLLRNQLPDEPAGLRENVDDLLALTDQTLSNLRLLSHNLRPPGLDSYGLHAALEGLCHDFRTHTRLDVRYVGCEPRALAELPALSLYRVAQEALTNVARHAEATAVTVALSCDAEALRLVVEDNGRGFAPPDMDQSLPAKGAGLLGMLERLEMVNGELRIEAQEGQGSRITAVVPYRTEETA